MMRFRQKHHPDSDTLERLVLGYLKFEQREAVEDHLLICEPCRLSFDAAEEHVCCVRNALRDLLPLAS
jgi:anti-sigma factor ChrR (cupin superfamily)